MLILKNRRVSLYGFAGLFGFFGCSYFFTGNTADLFAFSFFAFFSFFILGKLNDEQPDERWLENSRRAGYIAFNVALCFIFVIGFIAANIIESREIVVLGCALGWVTTWFTYALTFLHFERT